MSRIGKLYTHLRVDETTGGLSSGLARVVTSVESSTVPSKASSRLCIGEHAGIQGLGSALLQVDGDSIIDSFLVVKALSQLLHSEGHDWLRVSNELDTHFDEAMSDLKCGWN